MTNITDILMPKDETAKKLSQISLDEPLKYKKAKTKERIRTCFSCGHTWRIRKDKDPELCPNCHSAKWADPDVSFEFLKNPNRLLTKEELSIIISRNKVFLEEGIDELKRIQDIANELCRSEYPLLSMHFGLGDVEFILRAYKLYKGEGNEFSQKTETKKNRSTGS